MMHFTFYFVFSVGIFMGSTCAQFAQIQKSRFSEVIRILIFSFLWPIAVITFLYILLDEFGKAFKLWS